MPLYEYECETCGHRFEKIQKFSDPIETVCPKCGGHLRKLMSSPAIQFKGSGFYITDYGKKDSGRESGSEAKAQTKAKADAKADAKSDGHSGESAKNESAKSDTTEKTDKTDKTEKAVKPAPAETPKPAKID